MPTKPPLPGSAAAAAAAIGGVGTNAVAAPEGTPPGEPNTPFVQQADVRRPRVGDEVRYVAGDRSLRLAKVVYVHPWEGAFQVEQDPLYVNLFVWAIDTGDAQLWRESAVIRLPGEVTAFVPQVAWRDGAPYFAERTHTWCWPEE